MNQECNLNQEQKTIKRNTKLTVWTWSDLTTETGFGSSTPNQNFAVQNSRLVPRFLSPSQLGMAGWFLQFYWYSLKHSCTSKTCKFLQLQGMIFMQLQRNCIFVQLQSNIFIQRDHNCSGKDIRSRKSYSRKYSLNFVNDSKYIYSLR